MIAIEIPEFIDIKELKAANLPEGWNSVPHRHQTRKIGDELVQKNLITVLKVPSAVVAGDFNFILNSRHLDFYKIRIISA